MHDTIHVGEMSVTFLKTRHETGDALDLFELTVPPFARIPLPHIHRKYDETIFGVNGTLTWTLRDKLMQVRRGATLFIPRGTPHSYANCTHLTARILCLQTPGVLGPEYYREIASLFRTGKHPDLAAIGTVMSRYGVVPISQDTHIPLIGLESSAAG
ncbi:MAG TPA: cupin domain-containing protein [Edaphobacter sp.]|jgi:quercetin dioxygenase-like cupin family protein|nr:cupin domain-containing protein [Edaphobacter sp.]